MIVFGHRGSPGNPRFAENTPTSFRKALSQGAAGLEFDVRRSLDRTIVVIHDATIDRTTNQKGRIADLPYSTLSQFDAGFGDHIPRLSDVLEEFGSRCMLNIELKEADLAHDVARMVLEAHLTPRVVISAFDADDNDADSNSNWKELSSIAGIVSTALLASANKLRKIGTSAFIRSAQQLGAKAIHPQRGSVTANLVAEARNASLAVRVWTVNDEAEAGVLRTLGVDAIITDFPERFAK